MTLRTRPLSLINEPYIKAIGSPTARYIVEGLEETQSESNPWPYGKGSGTDVGSDFSNLKMYCEIDTPSRLDGIYYIGSSPISGYWGPIYSQSPITTMRNLRNGVAWSSALTLNGLGATAISRVIPTNPAVDAMTFAAEIAREGIPKAVGHTLLRDRKPSLKGAAEENLNYQFGILPVVSDTMGLVDTVSKSEKILKQYERDSGRNIRRQYRFPTIHENTTTSSVFGALPQAPERSLLNLVSSGQKTTVRTYTRDVWFSGCFTYYLNLGSSAADRLEYAAQQAKRLYGVRLTPDVLWNLAPWSWAADWVTNIGDVLHNLSAFSTDGLVMRYGYIMEHTVVRESHRITGLSSPKTVKLGSSAVGETYYLERKIRRRATPFGFGLDPGSFTTRQWSILASLGITRAMR